MAPARPTCTKPEMRCFTAT